MKKKIFSVLFALVLVLSFSLVTAVPVMAANPTTIASSTMVFESVEGYTLTYDSGTGIYSGMIPMVGTEPIGPGDGIPGYDVFAEEGASAWFGDDPDKAGPLEPIWTEVVISDNDAWPTYDVDTPDWYQYSLKLYEDEGVQRWRVANHSGATAALPWYMGGGSGAVEQGVPMSGFMDWTGMYAAETDVGEYLFPLDVNHGEIPGGAAAHGGGPMSWDMDWSWGSEVVPLQYPGFSVEVIHLDGSDYQVILTPALPSYGFVTGGGWIDSPPGAYMPGPTNIAGTFTGDYTSRFTNIECDPNNTPITFTGSVEVTGIQPNGAVMIGLVDQGLYDSGNYYWLSYGSGAYLYLGRSSTGDSIRVGPSDGFMGGEINQVGANVPYVDDGPNLVNFSMTIYNGEITVTYEGTDYVDTYGEIEDMNTPDAYPGNEFDSGAYVGLDSWPAENAVVYDIDISGCPCGPTGKATFGFVSKYKKGASVPDGQTEFMFKTADLNFHSSSYDWLVVTGSNFAKFKGIGTINGEGEYKFQIWAGDGDPDTFRIKIWEEVDSLEDVVYDNGMNQPIGGGNIVVHTSKK